MSTSANKAWLKSVKERLQAEKLLFLIVALSNSVSYRSPLENQTVSTLELEKSTYDKSDL